MRSQAQKKHLPSAEIPETESVASERAELLARKHAGQGLSGSEQARLDSLTSRLEQLLPPISMGELTALLEMAEEAERLREQARERRRRLGLSQPAG